MHRHAEYHYCVTVYRSDVQTETKVITKFDTYGFQFFPRITITGFTLLSQTHTSIDMHRHAEYHYCVTVYRSDVQTEI